MGKFFGHGSGAGIGKKYRHRYGSGRRILYPQSPSVFDLIADCGLWWDTRSPMTCAVVHAHLHQCSGHRCASRDAASRMEYSQNEMPIIFRLSVVLITTDTRAMTATSSSAAVLRVKYSNTEKQGIQITSLLVDVSDPPKKVLHTNALPNKSSNRVGYQSQYCGFREASRYRPTLLDRAEKKRRAVMPVNG